NPNQRCRPRWRHDHHCTNNQIGPIRRGPIRTLTVKRSFRVGKLQLLIVLFREKFCMASPGQRHNFLAGQILQTTSINRGGA
ncbi:hypothetical protein, partial [Chelativorans composti]